MQENYPAGAVRQRLFDSYKRKMNSVLYHVSKNADDSFSLVE